MTAKLYEGTKRLHATPMTRGEYNAYRGWENPASENPADGGYLVEYQDGGKANDSRHAGYISWSPADVFERTYRPVVTTLPVIDPGPDSLERAHADTHASAVLYPAIKRAMVELETLHPGFNDAANRAFNHLHDAFWSECPAPASAAQKRPEHPSADL